MLYSFIRASLNVERIRDYLAGNNRFYGYVMGSSFGAITPFCSCSSIPVFLGFTSAGIPVGITMSFLLTSPLINEVAVLLLLSLVGWKITIIYVLIGMVVGIAGGLFLDLIRAEKLLQPFALKAYQTAQPTNGKPVVRPRLSTAERHVFAKTELLDILESCLEVGICWCRIRGGIHGFVPESWFEENLGSGQWWSVPGGSCWNPALFKRHWRYPCNGKFNR